MAPRTPRTADLRPDDAHRTRRTERHQMSATRRAISARMGAPIGRLAGCAPVCALGGSLDIAVEDAESDVTREIEREGKGRGEARRFGLVQL